MAAKRSRPLPNRKPLYQAPVQLRVSQDLGDATARASPTAVGLRKPAPQKWQAAATSAFSVPAVLAKRQTRASRDGTPGDSLLKDIATLLILDDSARYRFLLSLFFLFVLYLSCLVEFILLSSNGRRGGAP